MLRERLEQVRERMVMGEGLMQELASLALTAPPPLAAEIERIAALAFECVTRNRATLTELIDDNLIQFRAA